MSLAYYGGQPMSRAGRKSKRVMHLAKPAEREPDDRVRTSRQPHRRGLPEALRLDERAESELGRLRLRGAISEPQYEAGCRWVDVVAKYKASIAGPRSGAGFSKGYGCDPSACLASWTLENLAINCECANRKAKYDDVWHALIGAGRRAMMVVNSVVIHDHQTEWLGALRVGLDALVHHFGTEAKGR